MKRFLKIVAILALFFVVIAYVLFRVVFFDPFASPRAALDPLIPKEVDVVVRRKELAKDFETFPHPRFFETLKLTDEWKALARTKLFRELEPKLGVEQQLAPLEALGEQVKPLDLTKDLIGREALVLCRFLPDGKVAKAAVLRGSFRAKFLVEAVKLGFARKSQGDLLQDYAEKEGVRSFTVNGERVHLGRVDDAIVVGDDFELVRDVLELGRGGGGKLSLQDSPQYRSAVLQPLPADWPGRSLDFAVDVAKTCRRFGWSWPTPPPDSEQVAYDFVRQFLVPERFGLAMGRLALGNEIELSLSVNADRVALAPASGGLFDGTLGELPKLRDFVGKVFPPKVAVAGYVKLDVKAMLHRVEALQPSGRRQMFNDFVVNLKPRGGALQPKSTVELLDAFANCVGDECAFAFEPGETYHVPGTPPEEMQYHDPHWGARVALVFPVADKALATQFVETIVTAVQAQPNAVTNVWRWNYPQGDDFREIKTVDSDLPTLSVGLIELEKRPCMVLTTTGAFLDEIVVQKGLVASGSPSGLQSELQFKQAAAAIDGYGQGFVFVSSPNLKRIVSDYCLVLAEIETTPDWKSIRADLKRDLLAARHLDGGKKLDPKEEHQLEVDLDTEIEKREHHWRDVALPARAEEMRGDLGGLDVVRWLALTLRVDERDLKLKLRVASAANFAADE